MITGNDHRERQLLVISTSELWNDRSERPATVTTTSDHGERPLGMTTTSDCCRGMGTGNERRERPLEMTTESDDGASDDGQMRERPVTAAC